MELLGLFWICPQAHRPTDPQAHRPTGPCTRVGGRMVWTGRGAPGRTGHAGGAAGEQGGAEQGMTGRVGGGANFIAFGFSHLGDPGG
jgi:hypothetical protein